MGFFRFWGRLLGLVICDVLVVYVVLRGSMRFGGFRGCLDWCNIDFGFSV